MATKTVGVAAVEVIPRNSMRKSLIIQNEDSTDTVWIKRESGEALTVSATDHDLKIGPGAVITLNWVNDGVQAIQDRYTAIASANTPRIAFFETEDIRR